MFVLNWLCYPSFETFLLSCYWFTHCQKINGRPYLGIYQFGVHDFYTILSKSTKADLLVDSPRGDFDMFLEWVLVYVRDVRSAWLRTASPPPLPWLTARPVTANTLYKAIGCAHCGWACCDVSTRGNNHYADITLEPKPNRFPDQVCESETPTITDVVLVKFQSIEKSPAHTPIIEAGLQLDFVVFFEGLGQRSPYSDLEGQQILAPTLIKHNLNKLIKVLLCILETFRKMCWGKL